MKRFAFFLLAFFLAVSATAAPIDREDVPTSLRPWIDWVLHGEKEDSCPIIYNAGDRKICAWPSVLNLDAQKTTAMFSQKWRVYGSDLWLMLPGNDAMWPQEVTVNGVVHPVGERGGRPAVFIENPGGYSVRGVFSFDRLPEWFRVPEQTGLIKLSINGKAIAFPRLDKEGRLWLRQEREKGAEAENRENRLQIRVQRLIEDDIPLRMTTRLELSVSGKHREVRLGRADTETFIPMRIDSDLPVKIDGDGTLLAQVRPGKWTIEFVARHKGPVTALNLASVGEFNNVDEETWAFAARRHLRQVTIEGPTQIDPLQTTVPDDWRQYPVYLMTSKDTMSFVEKKRGDPQPAPDQLNLERTLWLNFDGQGYSVRDQITGTMTTGWRLEMNPPQKLGRVSVNGQEQFITRLGDRETAGVEMRYGSVNLAAESRIKATAPIPVTGWDRDFQSVKGMLNLPPGWSLFSAAGIDNIRQTWLKRWNLLDLFLVLIIAVTVARLRGVKWGLLALITVVLLNHEAGAPRWIWLHLLAAIALLRVLPQGKIRALVDYYRVATMVILVVIGLPFMVSQIRNGVYPQLERPWQVVGQDRMTGTDAEEPVAGSRVMTKQAAGKRLKEMAVQAPAKQERKSWGYADIKSSPAYQVSMVDTGAKIQTGPGIPNWNWRRVSFSWNGPVGKGEKMKFVFISPGMNLVLALARVVLLAVMIFGLTGMGYVAGSGFDFSRIKPGQTLALMVMLWCLVVAGAADAADAFPPENLLKDLKIKLTDREAPPCLPDCASSPRMKLVLNETSLNIRMEIHALCDSVAVPLPGSDQHWLPETVLIDNRSAVDLYRSPSTGGLWLRVTEGSHQVDLRGKLPQRQTVQLPLPLKPHYVEARVTGWVVDGLHDNGVADRQLQFTRIAADNNAASESTGESFDPTLLPPFLEVNRTLSLGLTWRVDTTVRRLTPAGSAVVAAVPLLPGESVTSEIPVENGRVLLNIGPDQQYFSWSSSLEITDKLVLKAADTLDWTEVWDVNIGPVWHADIEGIPVVHHQDQSGNWMPEWRPWPGEEVVFHLSRPEGVGGQTHTIESSRLVIKPGQRITNCELNLAVRSSRGSRQVMALPGEAVLQTVEIDGKSQAIRQSGRNVTLPLTPGRQNIKFTWRENKELDWGWRTPGIDLGLSSVDTFITVHMPQNRWVLLCGGPYVGPAVMFWSVVLVICLMAVGLGRLDVTPLRFRHWLLLGLGLTQASLLIALPVVAWFLALGLRKRKSETLSGFLFNLGQVVLVGLTAAAMASLLFGIKQGLLGYPDMQIAGNGSGNYVLNWYQDISGPALPQAWVFSLPITIYRILILLWALWLAFAIVRWLRWAWECFSTGGLWKPMRFRKRSGRETAGTEETEALTLDLPDDDIPEE